MSPPCPSPTPPSSVANLPFKYRRKSFSEDNPDYYLVPPSPSLSPSRSLSLSSSPPSSPTTLATSPAGPSHLDTAAIHPPSSPTRPSAFHGYGYAYSYARVHDYDQHHYKLPHARPYAIVPPPAVSARSSVSAASPATSDGFRPVFPSRRTPHHDEDDDIEDYALGFDLDDLLAGSSPSRRISFNTSDERDKPFVRPPPKLQPLVASTSTSTASSPEPLHPRIDGPAVTRPRAAELRARDSQGESERTRASAPLVPLPPSATPICARSRTRTRSPAVSASAPEPVDAEADDVLPPSSPIASSPLSSPTRSSERESDSLPPSSPIPISTPQTPPRQADEDVEMEMEMDELFASPPSPTLDALRITSRVALRALMNPAPDLVLPRPSVDPGPAAVPERVRLPAVSAAAEEAVPVAEEDGPVVEEKMDVEGDGDVTPLVLGEAEEPVEEAEVDVLEISEEQDVQILGPAEEAVESIAEPITKVAVQITEPMALPVSRVPSVCGQPAEEAVEMTEQVVEVQIPNPTVCVSGAPLVPPSRAPSAVFSRAHTPVATGSRAHTPASISVFREHTPVSISVFRAHTPALAPLSLCRSRTPALVPLSRAYTPPFEPMEDVPSSPLSPAPSSIGDADVEFDEEDFVLPPAAVAGPSSHSSRAVSPVRVPPRKKARLDDDDRSDVPRPRLANPMMKSSTSSLAKPTTKVKKVKRSRTPTFTDSESEGDALPPASLKPKKKVITQAAPVATMKPKVSVKKRPRTVFSDDESEVDGPALSSSRPVTASTSASGPSHAPAATIPPPATMKRKREKPKKARAREREPESDLDVENTPLKPSPSGSGRTKAPARPKAKASAPKSATNIARPGLVASTSSSASECAPTHVKSHLEEHEQEDDQMTKTTGQRPREPEHEPRPAASPVRGKAPADAYDLPLPAAELEGMLIETLGTARASSMATSALYSAVMAAQPALREMALPVRRGKAPAAAADEDDMETENGNGKKGRGKGRGAEAASRRAWVPAIEGVLEAGWARCGVFGKVVNQGTDATDHELALEARWFYDPDRDDDAERANVIRSMMRRPGKRSETKKAKHYYWRPLPKISRWDGEDEL